MMYVRGRFESEWVFPGDSHDAPILLRPWTHQHEDVREILNLSAEFVIHSREGAPTPKIPPKWRFRRCDQIACKRLF
jgi:hypothetical protein